MSTVIVFSVRLYCPGLVVTASILVTKGAENTNELFINFKKNQHFLPENIGTCVQTILKIIPKECLKRLQVHACEITKNA